MHSILLVGNFLSKEGSHGPNKDLAVRLEKLGWNVLSTSSHPKPVLRLLDMVRTTWARRHDYDAAQVDVFGGRAFLWAQAVSWTLRRARKPYILTLHGGSLPVLANRWPRCVRAMLQSATAVTAPSRYLASSLEHFGKDILIVPNGLDLPNYPFRQRREPGPRLIWLRAFHRLYNPTLGPKVVEMLAEDFPSVTLKMIGPDKGDGSLEETMLVARRLHVADRVKFLGPIPKAEVAHHLEQEDIFLNTTFSDNTPVSVMEAMACGLCVVSTNVGGVPFLLEDRKDSLLVSPDSPEEMADAVRAILRIPGLSIELSRNARAKAEGFDWPGIMNEWENLLRVVQRVQRRNGRTRDRTNTIVNSKLRG